MKIVLRFKIVQISVLLAWYRWRVRRRAVGSSVFYLRHSIDNGGGYQTLSGSDYSPRTLDAPPSR